MLAMYCFSGLAILLYKFFYKLDPAECNFEKAADRNVKCYGPNQKYLNYDVYEDQLQKSAEQWENTSWGWLWKVAKNAPQQALIGILAYFVPFYATIITGLLYLLVQFSFGVEYLRAGRKKQINRAVNNVKEAAKNQDEALRALELEKQVTVRNTYEELHKQLQIIMDDAFKLDEAMREANKAYIRNVLANNTLMLTQKEKSMRLALEAKPVVMALEESPTGNVSADTERTLTVATAHGHNQAVLRAVEIVRHQQEVEDLIKTNEALEHVLSVLGESEEASKLVLLESEQFSARGVYSSQERLINMIIHDEPVFNNLIKELRFNLDKWICEHHKKTGTETYKPRDGDGDDKDDDKDDFIKMYNRVGTNIQRMMTDELFLSVIGGETPRECECNSRIDMWIASKLTVIELEALKNFVSKMFTVDTHQEARKAYFLSSIKVSNKLI